MRESLLLITTGGTIDKVYFDELSRYSVGEPQIGEVLRQARVGVPVEIHSLLQKDSLELTEADREQIRQAVVSAPQRRVLITHGTDTMAETGRMLAGSSPCKTVVLTGSLLPARFRDNDAVFNIGLAFGAVQSLPAGVYLAMNGCLFDPHHVRKDRERNCFVSMKNPVLSD